MKLSIILLLSLLSVTAGAKDLPANSWRCVNPQGKMYFLAPELPGAIQNSPDGIASCLALLDTEGNIHELCYGQAPVDVCKPVYTAPPL